MGPHCRDRQRLDMTHPSTRQHYRLRALYQQLIDSGHPIGLTGLARLLNAV